MSNTINRDFDHPYPLADKFRKTVLPGILLLTITIGSSSRMDFTVIGDSVNIASRLCSEAREGEIVIDQKSYQTITKDNNFQVELLQVKGKMHAINIVRV